MAYNTGDYYSSPYWHTKSLENFIITLGGTSTIFCLSQQHGCILDIPSCDVSVAAADYHRLYLHERTLCLQLQGTVCPQPSREPEGRMYVFLLIRLIGKECYKNRPYSLYSGP